VQRFNLPGFYPAVYPPAIGTLRLRTASLGPALLDATSAAGTLDAHCAVDGASGVPLSVRALGRPVTCGW